MQRRIFAISHAGAISAPMPHVPVARRGAASRPTALGCLRCQLVGRRNLLCSQVDACRALPRVFPLGPVIIAAWLATTIAFVVSIW